MGPHKQLIGMATESQRVVRDCEVTAILILYGLPRYCHSHSLPHEFSLPLAADCLNSKLSSHAQVTNWIYLGSRDDACLS